MNEISVIVNQKPGEITWNFEEIKSRLEADLAERRNNVYTDATIKTAKGNIAELRKLIGSIKERLKETKNKSLEPYYIIEAQANELIAMVEEPIRLINEQVQDYEKRRKEAARAVIMAYWLQKSDVLPENLRDKAKDQIYDTRWENATATKKSWKEGIDKGIQKILDEIATIQSFHSEFEQDMIEVYAVDLSLQKAIAKMNELKVQKERILKMERKRQEALAEKRRQEEEKQLREAEELRRKQEELSQREKTEEAEAISASDIRESAETEQRGLGGPSAMTGRVSESIECGNLQGTTQSKVKEHSGVEIRQIRISGTEQQIMKILDYIRFTGASYEEV